jgi:hypothetical protein
MSPVATRASGRSAAQVRENAPPVRIASSWRRRFSMEKGMDSAR